MPCTGRPRWRRHRRRKVENQAGRRGHGHGAARLYNQHVGWLRPDRWHGMRSFLYRRPGVASRRADRQRHCALIQGRRALQSHAGSQGWNFTWPLPISDSVPVRFRARPRRGGQLAVGAVADPARRHGCACDHGDHLHLAGSSRGNSNRPCALYAALVQWPGQLGSEDQRGRWRG